MQLKDDKWRRDIIYQIYPRSYYAKSGKPSGDLKGIAAKLGYIKRLGVDRVWLSPFFASPMKDYGYDVADYCKVDKMFGTNQDFYALVKNIHNKGMKIIIDQVYNHTSDQHPWFKNSAAGKDKKNWFVWADAKPDGSFPNNWLSIFGGSAWQWHPVRRQYYLHQFLKEQPDLNFNNDKVIRGLLDVAKFWLDKGVNGFRLDTAHCYTQDKNLTDNPPIKRHDAFFGQNKANPYFLQKHVYDVDYKKNVPFFERLRKLTNKYDDSFIVGEVGGNEQLDSLCRYTQKGNRLHSVYIFCFLTEFTTKDLYDTFNYLDKNLRDGYPCWAFSNHDVTRVGSRGKVPARLYDDYTRFMMALLLCLRGVPCIYQGEELGLPEAKIAYEDLNDPYGKEFWPAYKGRDGCRTPMPWQAKAKYGGFSKQKPWLPVPPEHLKRAVDVQEQDKNSMLWFTRSFIKWRQQQETILNGDMQLIKTASKEVFAFSRGTDKQRLLFLFNYSPRAQVVQLKQKVSKQLMPHEFCAKAQLTGSKVKLPAYGVFISQLS